MSPNLLKIENLCKLNVKFSEKEPNYIYIKSLFGFRAPLMQHQFHQNPSTTTLCLLICCHLLVNNCIAAPATPINQHCGQFVNPLIWLPRDHEYQQENLHIATTILLLNLEEKVLDLLVGPCLKLTNALLRQHQAKRLLPIGCNASGASKQFVNETWDTGHSVPDLLGRRPQAALSQHPPALPQAGVRAMACQRPEQWGAARPQCSTQSGYLPRPRPMLACHRFGPEDTGSNMADTWVPSSHIANGQ